MTNTSFNGKNLPTHHPSSVVIFTATTALLLPHKIRFLSQYVREQTLKSLNFLN